MRIKALIATVLLAILPVAGSLTAKLPAAYAEAANYEQDTSLLVFKANGADVTDGQTINLDQGSTVISIEALPTNDYATAETSANADALSPGENTVTVTVTAYDEVTTQVYTLHVFVAAPSSDTSLESVKVNGVSFAGPFDGTGIFYAPVGTTQVAVEATPTSSAAQVSVSGNTNLSVGSTNTVTIAVTAEDGTTNSFSFQVNVATPSSDTTLGQFAINGLAVTDNEIVEVPYGTTEVSVTAIANADTSTVSYTGNTNLGSGDSTVTVTVTSEAGTTDTHSVTIRVTPISTDRTIDQIKVNGEILVGNSIAVGTGVKQASLVVTLHSAYSTYAVTGNTDLNPGANTVTLTITSQDGNSSEFQFIVNVYQPSSNSALGTLTVDGSTVAPNSTLNRVHGVKTVNVVATAEDANATVTVTGATGLLTGSNTVTIKVTAENGSSTSYSFDVAVALSSNVNVASITIAGVDRTSENSEVQNTAKLATSVSVAVVTEDTDSVYVVSGNTDLTVGSHVVLVEVTAPDGSVGTYSRTINVPGLSSNSGLGIVKVDGVALTSELQVTKPHGTASVSVIATADDPYATASVSGATSLTTGSNTVTIVVTAEDGTSSTYTFTVIVLQSSDTSVSSITIDGVNRTSSTSAVQNTAKLATSVAVAVVTSDANAHFTVVGNTDLEVGQHVVTITVTAEDGTEATYQRTINVPGLSTDSSLSSITVDGVVVAAGGSVSKVYGTSSVTVVASAVDAAASVSVAGASGLVSGLNTVSVTVTAEDGSKASYSFTVNVAKSSDASVSSITVDGVDVTVSKVFTTLVGASSVAVSAQVSDVDASYVVLGASGLHGGSNDVIVRVSAADGSSQDYVVVVSVPVLSSDTSLSSITVDGVVVAAGGSVSKVYGTSSVTVVASAVDAAASVSVAGASGLVSGLNTVSVTVTAEDGSKASYSFTVNVAKSSDASVSSITVDGVDVTVSKVFTTLVGASSVAVSAQVSDVDASYVVLGASGLHGGSNDVIVRVSAADGSSQDYVVVVSVPVLSSDTSLSSITVDGVVVAAGGSVSKVYGTSSVTVVASAVDAAASVSVAGASGLVSGLNTVSVTVTAEDGSKASYSFTVNVAKSSDASVSSITVDGVDVTVSKVFTTLVGASSVAVSAQVSDVDASYVVLGASGLHGGSNDVIVRVSAADGSSQDYVVVVSVPVLSSDTSLSSITVDGVVVAAGGSVSKVYGTSSVTVVASAVDAAASVSVAGASGLVSGLNTVSVTVTAEDGSKASYSFTVNVAKSSDASVSSITVDGEIVAVGGFVSKPFGTSSVVVSGVASDSDASVDVFGATGLHTGVNAVTVRVSAADGVTVLDYVVYVSVTAASSDTGLAVFTVNGVNVLAGSQVDVGSDVSSVVVVAAASSDLASFQVVGGSALVVGSNTVSVTVTAQDGSFRVYSATVVKARPLSSDVSLSSITVNGSPVAVDGVFDVVYGTSSVSVVATASDVNASTQVFGVSGLHTGLNTVSVTVTAEDQSSRVYEFKVRVARSNNTGLLSVSVAGVAVPLGQLAVTVAPSVSSVVVSAVPVDSDAVVSVSGGSVLSFGLNTVSVTVVAADGVTSRVYSVLVSRTAYSSDKRLASLRVNGVLTEVGSVVRVEPGVASVSVVASVVDADASAVVLGASGLVPGDNAVTVRVTAADGSRQDYVFTVYVRPVSVDTSLKLFTVNGGAVVDGATVVLDGLSDFVTVVASANDVNAVAVVSGSTGLQFGLNTVTVTVTAESGLTQAHEIQVFYPDVTDASIKTFTVDGNDVADGDNVDLPTGTTAVVVVAESLYGGEVVIEGGADLQPGENTLTVTVTSLDGENSTTATVTLTVALSTDTSLATFTINGADVNDGDTLEFPPYTASVDVVAEANYEGATVDIAGGDALESGDNEVVVTVTAADGVTVQTYTVTITVLVSTETRIASIVIDGQDAMPGDVILATDLTVTEIELEVTTVDENATVDIAGNTDLVLGDNEITITVTAPSGDSVDYTIIYRLGGLAGNAKLKSLLVGTEVINLTAESNTVQLKAGTKTVAVFATTEDQNASVKVAGNKTLVTGSNNVVVTVTAADGSTVREYSVTVVVQALSSNNNLTSVSVNGSVVAVGSTTDLAAGTGYAEVVPVAEDSGASVAYSGNKNLLPGTNLVTITVTAANGAQAQYTITLNVLRLSSDTSLKSFVIEGFSVLGKTKLNVLPGTTKLHVSAAATDPGASVTIIGRDVVSGVNNVQVRVTAADGTSQTYLVKVRA